ncbi:malate dehydrogenase, putative [Perkinsus marinus ATCC 50983]|uniref:Malate dehydrogenase n=1 Tax=Perkinsus marinus (strain ATCC 50983 / TXsc) TaxID=423536 RepID=C5KZ34_PERM5|nr:malate dehydrogenase, putative [Perkinsus marinus ATCC 50983]EER10249.1 malate dehydrogenase, putative [Perkinsus marinus ATCC 50983]|eukprot:XP_002778454.1 malate dehydrogenase, putative [Perkinsus marinus ATCC 50983]
MSSTATTPNMKVTLVGASGAIGMPLSLLLKMNSTITELALYDVKQARVPVAGVAADSSHINSPAKVKGYAGPTELEAALTGSKVIVCTAGIAQKPGMSRDDLFNVNAGIMRDLATSFAKYAPEAVVCILSNPETALVPITAEVYKKAGVYDSRKIVGITTLDVTRARTFYAEATGMDVEKVDVPVVGGHGGCAILPLFSKATPYVKLDEESIDELDDHVQNAVTEVVDALAGAGSASLSMAYSAAQFVDIVIRGLKGESHTACAYVNEPYEDVQFFAHICTFGQEGVEKVEKLVDLTPHEQKRMVETLEKLREDIKRGTDFMIDCCE